MAKIKIKDLKAFVRANIISIEADKTGNIKVDVSKVFKTSPDGEELVLGAWYNYLGGGMIGKIVGASMFDHTYLSETDQKLFQDLKAAAGEVLLEESNGNDEYIKENHGGFDFNQNLPVSAY